MFIFMFFSIILTIIGAATSGHFLFSTYEREFEYSLGLIPLILGLALLTGIFAELDEGQQTPVSICIMENIETVEEVKTNGEIVNYKITLKDGTEFNVKPIKEEDN